MLHNFWIQIGLLLLGASMLFQLWWWLLSYVLVRIICGAAIGASERRG